MQDAELATSLITQIERLPAPLVIFAECLARHRDRMEAADEEFRLTDCQRNQAQHVLAGLERGLSGTDLSSETSLPDDLEELALRVRDLREQKKAIEQELTLAADQLAIAIGVGATVGRVPASGPIASERLSLSPEGKVIYQLRRTWRDGTTHIPFSPLTFIERLAALVPRPRVHLATYHGVLAPASTWRDMIIPSPPALTNELALDPNEPRGTLHEGQGSSSPAALRATLSTDLSSAGPVLGVSEKRCKRDRRRGCSPPPTVRPRYDTQKQERQEQPAER